MGEMNEFREPAYGQPEPLPRWGRNQVLGSLVLDAFRISITPGFRFRKNNDIILPDDLADQIDQLRKEIGAYEGCEAVSLARIGSLAEDIGGYVDGNPVFMSRVDTKTDVLQLLICKY